MHGGESITDQLEDHKDKGESPELKAKGVRINEGEDNRDGDHTRKSLQGTGKRLKAKKLTEEQVKSKNMKKRLDHLNATTRWLPDSAFTTYFGKPAFHLYGKGNTNPTAGGNIYG